MSLLRWINLLHLTLVQLCRPALQQNLPTQSQTDAPHLRSRKLGYNITPRVRLQCQREVVAELSILDRRVQVVDPLIDVGPTPAYQEGKDVYCIQDSGTLNKRDKFPCSRNVIECGRPVFRQNKLHLLAFVERSCKNLSRISSGQG